MDLVSPRPFWPLKNGLLSVYPALRQDLKCDVVVLGAGITGAFIAHSLAEEGLDIVVVDKRDVCAGSTSANTALLQYELDTSLVDLTKRIGRADAEQVYRVCYDSITAIERLVMNTKMACFYRRRKSVYLASRRSDAALLREERHARQAIGIEVEYWGKEALRRNSHSQGRPPSSLIELRSSIAIDWHTRCWPWQPPKEHAFSIGRSSKNIMRIAQEVRLETDRRCSVMAKHAVFATGYESQEFLPHHIVKLRSTYALASEPLEEFPGWWERCLIWETLRPYLYLRTTDDNRALVGGEDDDFHSPIRRDRRVASKNGPARLAVW